MVGKGGGWLGLVREFRPYVSFSFSGGGGVDGWVGGGVGWLIGSSSYRFIVIFFSITLSFFSSGGIKCGVVFIFRYILSNFFLYIFY